MNDFQNTAFFVKNPSGIDQLKIPHLYELRKRVTVVKTIKLAKIDYENFIADLRVDRTFIEENKELCRIDKCGVWFCLLIQQRGKSDGILVMPDGRDYPKYAAYYQGKQRREQAISERKLSLKKFSSVLNRNKKKIAAGKIVQFTPKYKNRRILIKSLKLRLAARMEKCSFSVKKFFLPWL